MDLLNKLTIKNLKLNKKRTIVTIIGIMLSVALITAVAGVYMSGISSLTDYEIYLQGDVHYIFYDVPYTDISAFKNNRKIDKVFLTKHLGYAKLEDSKNEYKPYANVLSFTKDSLENLSVKLVEGNLPQNENEILISTHLRTNGRVFLNVGDTITLDIGKRVDNEGNELNQFNPFTPNDGIEYEYNAKTGELISENNYEKSNEKIIDTQTKEYKIVGIIERPATNIEGYSAPGYTFITYMNNNIFDGKVDAYVKYTKEGLKEQYKVTANILGVDENIFESFNTKELPTDKEEEIYSKEMEKAKYRLDVNKYLIALETNPVNNDAVGDLSIVVLIVCVIIVFTSVFCIKNSFDISITEKTKQYGMLRSVGATKKQIRKNVFYEAFILGLIGIPLGLLFGFLATYILMIISDSFMKGMMSEGLKLHFAFSWIAVIFAIVLGLITIYFSAIRSARRASKISPIDSIRNSADIKIKAKKLKVPRIINKALGIGGEISYKNLKRNKKKYRTTVISIVVSVSIFIALSSFVGLAFLEIKNEVNMTDYNISLYAETQSEEQDANDFYTKVIETTKFDGVEEYTIFREVGFYISNAKYSEKYKAKDSGYNEEDFKGYINVCCVGEKAYKNYIKELGLQYEDVKNKAILMDMNLVGKYDKDTNKAWTENVREFTYNIGDTLSGKLSTENEEKFEIDIAKVTDKKPFGLSNMSGSLLIVSDELYDSKLKNNDDKILHMYYKSNNPDQLQNDLEGYLTGYGININNVNENKRAMESLFTLVAIFLYGFIIVISLIGITNIFNTITTNMELRRQEFAMLKSIGMTKKEFSRMIRLESLFMGIKSLLFGLPIGIGLSYLIYHFLAKDGMAYPIPVKGIVISIVAVFILITSLMRYSINKINKQNTIETIRNENI